MSGHVVIKSGIKAADGIKYLDFLTEEEYLEIAGALPKENQLPRRFRSQQVYCWNGSRRRYGAAWAYWSWWSFIHSSPWCLIPSHYNNVRLMHFLLCLQVVEAFQRETWINRNGWSFKVVPVIPPELRPLVPLDEVVLLHQTWTIYTVVLLFVITVWRDLLRSRRRK